MAVCTKCGATLNDGAAFCSSCGTPIDSAPGAGHSTTIPVLSLPGIAFNVAGLLSYILWPVACIFFLIFDPYNKNRFVRFHAFQGLFLGIAGFALAFGLSVVTSILSLIPAIGWILGILAWTFLGVCYFGIAILMMYKAYNGQWSRIPWIGDLAAQQAEKL